MISLFISCCVFGTDSSLGGLCFVGFFLNVFLGLYVSDCCSVSRSFKSCSYLSPCFFSIVGIGLVLSCGGSSSSSFCCGW